MGIVGFQDFWVVGSRFYYKREGVDQPLVDLGVIRSVTPNFNVDKIELKDSGSGVGLTVDESVTAIDENYDITCANFNNDNLSILFLGDSPVDPSRTAQTVAPTTHDGFLGQLTKVMDATGSKEWGIGSIVAVLKPGINAPIALTQTVDSMSVSAGTITFSADVSSDLTAGQLFYVTLGDMDNPGNAQTYKVHPTTAIASSVVTLDTTVSSPVANESGKTAPCFEEAPSNADEILEPTTNYDVVSVTRGFIRMLDAAPYVADGPVKITYTLKALSGLREFSPQAESEIRGSGKIVLSRGGNAQQTAREIPLLAMSPSSADFNADDFSSWVLNVKVLTHPTKGAGRIIQFHGAVPATQS